MRKLITFLVGILACTSFSFATFDDDVAEKVNQLSPIINIILKSNEYTDQQKSLITTILDNCAKSNANDCI